MFRNRLILIAVAAAMAHTAAAQKVSVAIDATKTGAPIAKHIYGQFLEHHRTVINGALWSEMLDDRKFYYPVNSSEKQVPQNRWIPDSQDWERRTSKRWLPVGPDEFVVMDGQRAYVGDHTPMVKIEGAAPHGIQQSGLVLRNGKSYTGRIVLAGEPGAKVQVSLIWGPGAADRQTIPIASLKRDYAKFPLKFAAKTDTSEGRLEIVGTGQGSFHIGAVSLMPSDNAQGFRPDTIKLLRALNSGNYRWPGGNFLSGYDWRDGIGDPDKRPQRWDHAWNFVEPNDVGIDEFMILCGLVAVEPYISVNSGFGDAYSAAQWVEYANGPVNSPMGRLRAANGHPAPYSIKLWNIGNEMYGSWQMGNMSLAHYVIKHNMFAKAMRQVDPGIILLASGAALDEMTVTRNAQRITGKVLAEYGGPADWTGGLLANCADNIDIVTEHFYAQDGRGFDLEKGAFVKLDEPLVEWARKPANRIRAKVEHYEEYYKRIPALKGRRVPMNIDEYHYGNAILRVSLSYAWAFHEMFRHSDIITMAAYTFATRLMDYDSVESAYNTHGLVFKLYRDHYGTIPVEVSGNSPQPPPKYPVGGDQPRVNAGSDSYPVDVAAAFTSDRKALTVAVVNPTAEAQEIDISFKGVPLAGKGRMWRMTGTGANAVNRLRQKPQAEVTESPVNEAPANLSLAPVSVTLYEFALR